MLAFIEMLIKPAEDAGMKIPDNLEDYDANEYPHFYVYSRIQKGAPMPFSTAHFHNAQVIAKVPEDKIRKVTYDELVKEGLAVGYNRI